MLMFLADDSFLSLSKENEPAGGLEFISGLIYNIVEFGLLFQPWPKFH